VQDDLLLSASAVEKKRSAIPKREGKKKKQER
jgi:hypothetical protein